ncbi:MAG: GNAT family N-acetyltransferase, partial [Lentisphaeria bacterium]|nr:GNAT family N-acetyltransferase [Lentisphaeria bacterium]
RKVEQNKLHEMIVVRQGDEAIGCCQYNFFGMTDRVGPFRVADHMNGKGIGTLMIAKLFEVMTQNNIKHAWFASCVKSLVYFYGKNGLQVFREKAVFCKDL